MYSRIDMREYIYDMPQVLAAADLIVCRAGAATIAEVCASGTPCIMVPSPNVTGNHQEKNARVLERSGAAAVVREADCDGKASMRRQKRFFQMPDGCAPCVPAPGIWLWSMQPSAFIRPHSTLQSTDTHTAHSA